MWLGMAGGRPHRFPHNNFSSVYRIFTKLGHMITMWKGKNPMYFTIIMSKVEVTYYKYNFCQHGRFRITLVLYIGSLPNLTTWFPCERGRTLFILGSLGPRSRSLTINIIFDNGCFRMITLVRYIGSLTNLGTWFPCGRGRTLFILGSLDQKSRSPLLLIDFLTTGSFPHDNFSSVHWIFTKLGHMIPLLKRKNPIYFGVITIIPFDNLYRRAYFVMHTFLVIILILFLCYYFFCIQL
jgi:hypothetical protein